MKQNDSLLFFGNERLATGITTDTPILRGLIDNGYIVKAVVLNDSGTKSRKYRDIEVIDIAKKHNIPVIFAGKPDTLRPQLAAYQAEFAVLAAFGKIIPQTIIDLFPHGIINIHPSLLPAGRGPTPVEQAILTGAQETGVSLMKLSNKMDEGPVFAQKKYPLNGRESKQSLSDALSGMGAALLTQKLPAIIGGTLKPEQQDNSGATYSRLINKKDGAINWNKTAREIEREVRAYATWPGSYTKLGGIDVIITSISLGQSVSKRQKSGQIELANRKLSVAARDRWLVIENLKPAGKGEMNAEAFISGYGHKLSQSSQ